jgi:hypothetical protein
MENNLGASPTYQALERRVRDLEMRVGKVSGVAFAQQEKRYRLAASNTALLVGAGSTATVSVSWTAPFASADYKVDVAVAALLGQPVTNIAVTNRTTDGCTVSFTVPALLALGTAVTVLAISAPSS